MSDRLYGSERLPLASPPVDDCNAQTAVIREAGQACANGGFPSNWLSRNVSLGSDPVQDRCPLSTQEIRRWAADGKRIDKVTATGELGSAQRVQGPQRK